MKKVHFVVEKYSRKKNDLLLDFAEWEEFEYVKNRDARSKAGLYIEPSMILVHACSPQKALRHGTILELDMDGFLEIVANSKSDPDKIPAMIRVEIQDGDTFAALIDKG